LLLLQIILLFHQVALQIALWHELYIKAGQLYSSTTGIQHHCTYQEPRR
jgi:hypothetical protein